MTVARVFLLLSFFASAIHCLQTRTSLLRPWKQPDVILGRTREFRDADEETYRVCVEWLEEEDYDADDKAQSQSHNNQAVIHLPFLPQESLASTLWPGSLAGAILCRSPSFRALINNKTVHEVGAGLGLTGLTVSKDAARVELSDSDKEVLDSVQNLITSSNNPDHDKNKVGTRLLDWRDITNEEQPQEAQPPEPVDLVLGTDVAYYFFLLRPLMDTIQVLRRRRDNDKSIAMILGQANRESQWDLYHAIRDGCYNQRTDKHEEPWPGTVHMLLYNLHLGEWRDDGSDSAGVVDDGATPITCLLHEMEGGPTLTRFSSHDYVSTDKDENEMMMSF